MRRRLAWLVLATLLGPAAARPAPKFSVAIREFRFHPQTLTVPAGATVRWTNRDEEPHTVVSVAGAFKSHALDTDESFTFRFAKPGRYRYFCSVHPRMVATIVVTGR